MPLDTHQLHDRFRPLAAALGRGGTEVLLGLLEEESYAPGDVVVDLDSGDWMLHLLECGRDSVQLPGRSGLAEVGELEAGAVLGEVAFLDHSLHTAQVVADTLCVCHRLSTASRLQLWERDPVAAANLERVVC